ncbi:MAG: DNA methyltransferase [Thermodesulfobacteriota bacterium]
MGLSRVKSSQLELPLSFGVEPQAWSGCFNARESSLHQLAPFVGKMKSGMARQLILHYTEPGDTVLDPFCGSGIVPLEAALLGRHAIGNDLSPYAYTITHAKLFAPENVQAAFELAQRCLVEIEAKARKRTLEDVPEWVQRFFHPRTLKEVLAAVEVLQRDSSFFLLACLMGILHHVRPGFLSYPASHLTPYLRTKKYPPEQYQEMYRYRDLRSRLFAKVERAYRRHIPIGPTIRRQALCCNAMSLPLEEGSVDAVISSPPYFGALDYARDNRLRLWFLGVHDHKDLEQALTANDKVYVPEMRQCLVEFARVLRPGAPCVLVLGDVSRNGRHHRTADTISRLASEAGDGRLFQKESMVDDSIPDERRSRRRTKTTLVERILTLRRR